MFNKKLEEEIKQLKNNYESQERILRNELQLKIDEAMREEKDKNQVLRELNAKLNEQVKILEKAFENMGFDVKDMKDILNKLVDGLVAKNEIKILNPISK